MAFKNMHHIPPILQDYCEHIFNANNSDEVREAYLQKIESIEEYCGYVIGQYRKQLQERTKQRSGGKAPINSGL